MSGTGDRPPADTGVAPENLRTVEFQRVTVGGYDRKAVREFLGRIADQFDDRAVQIHALEAKNTSLRAEVEVFRAIQGSLRQTVASSHKYNEELIDAANREARAFLTEVRIEVQQAEIDAHKRSAEAISEAVRQRCERNRLRAELVASLESYKKFVERLGATESEAPPEDSPAVPEPGPIGVLEP